MSVNRSVEIKSENICARTTEQSPVGLYGPATLESLTAFPPAMALISAAELPASNWNRGLETATGECRAQFKVALLRQPKTRWQLWLDCHLLNSHKGEGRKRYRSKKLKRLRCIQLMSSDNLLLHIVHFIIEQDLSLFKQKKTQLYLIVFFITLIDTLSPNLTYI